MRSEPQRKNLYKNFILTKKNTARFVNGTSGIFLSENARQNTVRAQSDDIKSPF